MRTVRGAGRHELVIQRSRFLRALQPVDTPDRATAFIEAVRKEHWSATHHCTAFRIGPNGEQQRSNDDGEPAGTAGVPMLQVLVAREITDAVAVVTGWFGGIKLGAGGLVRAYGRCVGEAIDAVGTLDLVPHTAVTVRIDHAAAGRLEHDLHTSGYDVTDTAYGSDVTVQLLVPTGRLADFERWLAQVSAGAADMTAGRQRMRAVPTAG